MTIEQRSDRTRRWIALLCVLAAAGACDDPLANEERPPAEGGDRIYSLTRAEYAGRPSGFALAPPDPRAVEVDAPDAAGTWDVALADRDGGLELLPAAALDGQVDARIVRVTDRTFAELTEAPESLEEYDTTAVVLEADAVYVVRSGPRGACVYYSKLRPVDVDAAAGTARFEYLLNQNCGVRDLTAEDG